MVISGLETKVTELRMISFVPTSLPDAGWSSCREAFWAVVALRRVNFTIKALTVGKSSRTETRQSDSLE